MKQQTPQQVSPLERLRPSERTLDEEWTPARRAAVYAQIRADIEAEVAIDRNAVGGDVVIDTMPLHRASSPAVATTPPRMSRRRSLVVMGSVAATVAALLAIPLLLPSGAPAGPSTARALNALAAAAATTSEQPLQDGQFRHAVEQATQTGNVITIESWTAADGHIWRRDTYGEAAGSPSMLYAFPPGDDSVNYPSPAFLRTLPTEPVELETYLREHVSGSSSQDEAVFVTVGDFLRGGFAPPALRSAALQVLERNPHVTARAGHDSLGRDATIVEFVDEVGRPGEVQSMYLDPSSAAILEESRKAPALDFQNVVVSREVADAVPMDVLQLGSSRGLCVTATDIVQSDDVCTAAMSAGAVTTSATPASESVGVAVPRSANPIMSVESTR